MQHFTDSKTGDMTSRWGDGAEVHTTFMPCRQQIRSFCSLVGQGTKTPQSKRGRLEGLGMTGGGLVVIYGDFIVIL